MNVKLFITPFLCATLILLQSCNNGQQKDIIADNFNFAAQQLLYAIDLTVEVISKDSRDSATKASRPLVSPRTLNEDGSLKVVPAHDWTSGFFPVSFGLCMKRPTIRYGEIVPYSSRNHFSIKTLYRNARPRVYGI